ncbi:MAG: hypothetical protein WCK09_05295 [Bacteroidota bacterium]
MKTVIIILIIAIILLVLAKIRWNSMKKQWLNTGIDLDGRVNEHNILYKDSKKIWSVVFTVLWITIILMILIILFVR